MKTLFQILKNAEKWFSVGSDTLKAFNESRKKHFIEFDVDYEIIKDEKKHTNTKDLQD